jgi:hypothetical protein
MVEEYPRKVPNHNKTQPFPKVSCQKGGWQARHTNGGQADRGRLQVSDQGVHKLAPKDACAAPPLLGGTPSQRWLCFVRRRSPARKMAGKLTEGDCKSLTEGIHKLAPKDACAAPPLLGGTPSQRWLCFVRRRSPARKMAGRLTEARKHSPIEGASYPTLTRWGHLRQGGRQQKGAATYR